MKGAHLKPNAIANKLQPPSNTYSYMYIYIYIDMKGGWAGGFRANATVETISPHFKHVSLI